MPHRGGGQRTTGGGFRWAQQPITKGRIITLAWPQGQGWLEHQHGTADMLDMVALDGLITSGASVAFVWDSFSATVVIDPEGVDLQPLRGMVNPVLDRFNGQISLITI
jgi:hypothetical protein